VDGLTELASKVVVFSTTTKVPVPVAVPDWHVPPPLPASTVNVVEPGSVAFVVVIVRVEVGFVFVTEDGLKEAFAPVGRVGGVWILSGDVHALPLPLKPTVTTYTAEPAGATGLGAWVPTVTVSGFESVNVFWATNPEVPPVAFK
jgi:hypothetical protein